MLGCATNRDVLLLGTLRYLNFILINFLTQMLQYTESQIFVLSMKILKTTPKVGYFKALTILKIN